MARLVENYQKFTQNNKSLILDILQDLQDRISSISAMISSSNSEDIYNFFAHAKNYRDQLPAKQQGALTTVYDLYVDNSG